MEGGLDRATRRRLAVPAALFALYVLHLVFRRTDPFLTRWIDGCFAFFLALVLAYVIVRGAPPGRPPEEPGDGPGPHAPGA